MACTGGGGFDLPHKLCSFLLSDECAKFRGSLILANLRGYFSNEAWIVELREQKILKFSLLILEIKMGLNYKMNFKYQ